MSSQNGNQNACCRTVQADPAHQASEQRKSNSWSYIPQMDVIELPHEYTIACDAPGLQKDGFDLTYDRGVLHLHGVVPPRGPEAGSFLRQEYGVGDFDREIPLGRLAEFVDGERIHAAYEGGVLTIHMPKLEKATARKIEVQVN